MRQLTNAFYLEFVLQVSNTFMAFVMYSSWVASAPQVRAAAVNASGRCTRARVSRRVLDAAGDRSALVAPQAHVFAVTSQNVPFLVKIINSS